jgi:restriction system protein
MLYPSTLQQNRSMRKDCSVKQALDPLTHGLWQMVLSLWPLWLGVTLLAAGNIGLAIYRHRRLARSGIGDIDRMSGHEFELYLGTLFRRFGYHVEQTGKAGDFGADLVIKKDQSRTVVQAKRYRKHVGVKAIQEVVAAKRIYQCSGAMVITNSHFTKQAQTLAAANDVVVWDRDRLIKVMLTAQPSAPSQHERS